MTRQDSSFYHYEPDTETVWLEEQSDFYVVRNGDMRIHYKPDTETEIVIRYTDELEEIGVRTDKDLNRFIALGDGNFDFIENSWFEIWHKEDSDFYSDPIHTLDEAIKKAKELQLEEQN